MEVEKWRGGKITYHLFSPFSSLLIHFLLVFIRDRKKKDGICIDESKKGKNRSIQLRQRVQSG